MLPRTPAEVTAIKVILMAAGLLLGSGAMACKQLVVTRLTFADGSAELEHDQVVKLARFITEANAAFPRYRMVTIDGGATVKDPARPPAEYRRLARQRAANAARAYAQLQPLELQFKTAAEIYGDRHLLAGASDDSVIVQFHLDYESIKLPDCNPVPIPGLKR